MWHCYVALLQIWMGDLTWRVARLAEIHIFWQAEELLAMAMRVLMLMMLMMLMMIILMNLMMPQNISRFKRRFTFDCHEVWLKFQPRDVFTANKHIADNGIRNAMDSTISNSKFWVSAPQTTWNNINHWWIKFPSVSQDHQTVFHPYCPPPIQNPNPSSHLPIFLGVPSHEHVKP